MSVTYTPRFKPNRLCHVCTKITQDGGQSSRLYKLFRAYHKDGVTLIAISEEYGISYDSVRTHATKHQLPTNKEVAASGYKKAIRQADRDRILVLEQQVAELKTTTEQRTAIIEKGMKGILDGTIKLSGANVVSALKHQDDLDVKKADQGLAIMDMLNRYISGEVVDPKSLGDPKSIGMKAIYEGEVAE